MQPYIKYQPKSDCEKVTKKQIEPFKPQSKDTFSTEKPQKTVWKLKSSKFLSHTYSVLNAIAVFIITISLLLNIVLFFMAYNQRFDLGMTGSLRTIMAYQDDSYARSLAVNITRDCNDDLQCSFNRLTDYMIENFTYSNDANVQSRLYNIEQTEKDKSGDCEGLSYYFAKLYSQVGGLVTIRCPSCHCYTKSFIPSTFGNLTSGKEMVFDPTSKKIYMWSPEIDDMYDRMCDEI